MPEFQAYATYIVFGLVIMAITFNWLDMTLAAMLGLCVLTVAGVIVQKDILKTVAASQGPLALLFGGMVVARVLVPTGIFDHLGTRFLILTRGSGKRFLLLLVALIAVVCAILPNATAVILVAPVIIRVCRELDVDFLGPMVLTAIVSNAAGLLTLVGDPATFFVGQAMGISFVGYLEKVSLGGVLAIVTVADALVVFPGMERQVRACRGPATHHDSATVFLYLRPDNAGCHGGPVFGRRQPAQSDLAAIGGDHRCQPGPADHPQRQGRTD